MKEFIPKKLFYEQSIMEYEQGKKLLNKYLDMGIPCEIIQAHHNVQEHRKMDDKYFVDMKKYLVLATRKTQKFVPNEKVSDYLVPYTSSGCPAICTYCYLVCNFFKCSYLRVFVNRDKMLEKIIKHSKEYPNKVYEIGSTSDLIIENTITHNLPWTIEKFVKEGSGVLTFPTKFHTVDDITCIDPHGQVIVRMSLNPKYIINKVEIGTSSLDLRLKALIKLHNAGYRVGVLIAPIVLIDGYSKLYEELFKYMAESLPMDILIGLKIEIIFMTYSQTHININSKALPNVLDVYDENLMKKGYKGKIRYRESVRVEAEKNIVMLLDKYLSMCEIVYIC